MANLLNMKYNIKTINGLLTDIYACYRRKIQSISIFATNRCNSKCKICYIWNEKPKVDLNPNIIEDALKSKFINKSCSISLVGGEFILHPDYKDIIKIVKKRTKNYTLYSNGIFSDKIIENVKKFKIPNLQMSLDGTRETYKKVRGVDKYDNVINVIENLKGKTKIGVIYTINPLNTRKDLIHVMDIVKKNNINIGVGVYDRRGIYHTKLKINNYDVSDFFKNNFLKSYNLWINQNLNLPCYSIRNNLTIFSNGNIPLCQGKNIILGNLYKNNLDKIWKDMIPIQDKYKDCNDCWLTCHRGFDNNLCKLLNTIFPEILLNKFIGKYDWKKIGGLFND